MNPLQTTKLILTWLCIYPAHQPISNRLKLAHVSVSVLLFIFNLNGLIASVAYFLKFVASDLESALYAMFQADTLMATAYTNIDLLFSKDEIVAIFVGLTGIFNASNRVNHDLYHQKEKNI